MEYRRLGRTGVMVSELCLGAMTFGRELDEAETKRMFDAFIDAGGNFIDTADVYSRWIPGNPGGVSEEIIGRWLKQRGNRYEYVIATKGHGRMWEGPNGEGLSRIHLIKAAEDSLRRLGVDYIDLYQTHWPRSDVPQEETMRVLDDLVRDGKVRYIGCSNEPAWRLCKSLWISEREHFTRFISLQPPYSLVRRAGFERENEALCLDQGIGVIPYSPLQAGFLTGKYRRDTQPDSVRSGDVRKYLTERNFALIDLLEQLGSGRGATVTQSALDWMLQRPAITAPIIGANSIEPLQDILGTHEVRLEPEEVEQIVSASDLKGAE